MTQRQHTFLFVAVVYGLLAAACVGFGVLVACRPARSAPPDGADPALAPWFEGLRQPGTGMSCCSEADCREVDYRETPGGYEVWITDPAAAVLKGAKAGIAGYWVPVPKDKVLQGKDNPTGRGVVCWTPALGVLCFVRGTEA